MRFEDKTTAQLETELDCILKIHANLPRQGPGSDEMTAHALSFVPALSDSARVFDMGCGPGRAALILASNLKTAVVAVDLVPSFLDQLRQSASAAGLDQKIEPRLANMSELDEPAESIDLIWAEGAVYNIGFDNALKTWRHLLKPEGTIACSELSWLTDRPSEEAAAFWR